MKMTEERKKKENKRRKKDINELMKDSYHNIILISEVLQYDLIIGAIH
jgi:hypothetical protein